MTIHAKFHEKLVQPNELVLARVHSFLDHVHSALPEADVEQVIYAHDTIMLVWINNVFGLKVVATNYNGQVSFDVNVRFLNIAHVFPNEIDAETKTIEILKLLYEPTTKEREHTEKLVTVADLCGYHIGFIDARTICTDQNCKRHHPKPEDYN